MARHEKRKEKERKELRKSSVGLIAFSKREHTLGFSETGVLGERVKQ